MKRKTVLTLSAAALMCLASALLPGAVLALRDLSLARSTETVAVDQVELSLLSSLDAARKLRLAGDSSAEAIPLETGRAMTGDEAVESAVAAQRDMGLYMGELAESAAAASLLVSGEGESMVLWDVSVTWSGSGMRGRYLIDDETGDLLGVELSRDGGETPSGDGTRKETAESSAPLAEAGEENGVMVFDADGAALDPATEDTRDIQDFHDAAGAFLRQLDLDYLLISVESRDSVLVHVDSDSGRVLLPMTVRDGYLSLNMAAH